MSATQSQPSHQANRLERMLGITDRHGWLSAWWQAFVIGSVFVVVSLVGYHSPRPHDVPVAIVGTSAKVQQVEAEVEGSAAGAYRFRRVAVASAADRDLHRGNIIAIVDLTGPATIRYAGAQGPTAFAALAQDLVPAVGHATGTTPVLTDTLPLARNDAAALPLFYVCFAVVLSSYLFSITTTNQARQLRAWGHWTSAAALAVSLGAVAALIARFGTDTVSAHTTTIAFVLMLVSLGTGATSYLLLRLSSTFGSVLGTVILIILGSASGGVVPGAFLPAWLATLRPVLPMGVALTTIRDTVYFGGHHLLRGLAALILWAVLPLVVAMLWGRRTRHVATPPSAAPAAIAAMPEG